MVNAVQHTCDCSRLTIVLLVRYAVTHCDVWNVERGQPASSGQTWNRTFPSLAVDDASKIVLQWSRSRKVASNSTRERWYLPRKIRRIRHVFQSTNQRGYFTVHKVTSDGGEIFKGTSVPRTKNSDVPRKIFSIERDCILQTGPTLTHNAYVISRFSTSGDRDSDQVIVDDVFHFLRSHEFSFGAASTRKSFHAIPHKYRFDCFYINNTYTVLLGWSTPTFSLLQKLNNLFTFDVARNIDTRYTCHTFPSNHKYFYEKVAETSEQMIIWKKRRNGERNMKFLTFLSSYNLPNCTITIITTIIEILTFAAAINQSLNHFIPQWVISLVNSSLDIKLILNRQLSNRNVSCPIS